MSMPYMRNPAKPSRRRFLLTTIAAAGALPFCSRVSTQEEQSFLPQMEDPDSVKTNIAAALAVQRTELSMPGPYPGLVVETFHPRAVSGRRPDAEIAAAMLAAGMKSLTGAADERDAWARFFNASDRVGIKVNPVGGKLAGVAHELVWAVIAGLESIGMPRNNMVLWERYEQGLTLSGYTPENFPGVEFQYFHQFEDNKTRKNPRGLEFYDKSQYYWADHVLPDKDNEMEYMLHNGPESYFPLLLTRGVDKIINIPVIKHHIASFLTLGFKNLAFGAVSNCVRGHDFINRYIAEVCAFPCFRDKTVLTIFDGLRGQYNAGPSPVAKYVWNHNRIYVATDPVAAEAVGFDVLFNKQVEEGVVKAEEKEDYYKRFDLLTRAENLGLGVFKGGRIDLRRVELG